MPCGYWMMRWPRREELGGPTCSYRLIAATMSWWRYASSFRQSAEDIAVIEDVSARPRGELQARHENGRFTVPGTEWSVQESS